MIYHLCLRNDGRVVLDREIVGFSLEQIEVADPPLVWRWVQSKWTQVPAYAYAYDAARGMVSETGRIQTSEGWFLSEAAYRAYMRSRLGECD